jgi:hypothetical protein
MDFAQFTLTDIENHGGFKSDIMEHLALNQVSKDEVVLELEKDPNFTLSAAIGNVLSTRTRPEVNAQVAEEKEAARVRDQAVADAEQAAQDAETPVETPVAEEVAPVSEEASKLPSEDSAAE